MEILVTVTSPDLDGFTGPVVLPGSAGYDDGASRLERHA